MEIAVSLSEAEINLILTSLDAYRDFIPVLSRVSMNFFDDPDGDPDVMQVLTSDLPRDFHAVFSKLYLALSEYNKSLSR